jgi:hypothetical protein
VCGRCAKEDSTSGACRVILGGVKAHDTTLTAASKMPGTVCVAAFVLFPLLVALIACAVPLHINDHDEKVLRIVPQADTVWSSATTRNHGYMIYDTLFGMGRSADNISRRLSKDVRVRRRIP